MLPPYKCLALGFSGNDHTSADFKLARTRNLREISVAALLFQVLLSSSDSPTLVDKWNQKYFGGSAFNKGHIIVQ